MDKSSSLPGSPVPGRHLNPLSPDRANTPRESSFVSSLRSELRDSSVHDKISQFNTLAMQSKSLERKTADAALKRAMLGREEAECDMRRYKEENKVLKVQLDKAKDREQRVSERLETVMEQYGRAKETYAHTKTAWEKEIKQARKKTFKNDATIIKLQEELKSARDGWRTASDAIDTERARNKAREQEAFEARYQMVGLEEKLGEALERVKVLEQERDAFKTLAKEEEVARIAAEGRIPLPRFEARNDEFASPRKKQRVSLSTAVITSSAASEEELEELARQVDWERQRADRAYEMIDFMHAECRLRTCEASKFLKRQHILSPRRVLVAPQEIADPSDLAVLGRAPSSLSTSRPVSRDSLLVDQAVTPARNSLKRKSRDEGRRSTIFCAREGIFRTVSQAEADVLESRERQSVQGNMDHEIKVEQVDEAEEEEEEEFVQSTTPDTVEPRRPEERLYARTPSVEPPAFALLPQERTSLASLLNAPHTDAVSAPMREMNIPTMPDVMEVPAAEAAAEEMADAREDEPVIKTECLDDEPAQEMEEMDQSGTPKESSPQACITTAYFQTHTTTTSVPVHDEKEENGTTYRLQRARTPSSEGHASFDVNNPAMTPTCTREEALRRIRERRGRARSAALGLATPRRQMVEGGTERRDMSAPTVTTTASSSAASAKRPISKVRKIR